MANKGRSLFVDNPLQVATSSEDLLFAIQVLDRALSAHEQHTRMYHVSPPIRISPLSLATVSIHRGNWVQPRQRVTSSERRTALKNNGNRKFQADPGPLDNVSPVMSKPAAEAVMKVKQEDTKEPVSTSEAHKEPHLERPAPVANKNIESLMNKSGTMLTMHPGNAADPDYALTPMASENWSSRYRRREGGGEKHSSWKMRSDKWRAAHSQTYLHHRGPAVETLSASRHDFAAPVPIVWSAMKANT
ncbi:hypothetical protein B0H13DRAFT_1852541 [Mycena leptocephala]|nr:hypothetical protein B0H13DRAFT_1852541 [Mycena leptocephala]